MACSQCTFNEARTVPLCLDCYIPYHRKGKQEKDEEVLSSLYSSWEVLDQSNNMMIAEDLVIPHYPCKKEADEEEKE